MKPVMLALSVVVPLFNEQDSLRPLVSQLLEAVRPLGVAFELVLVDDGSKDATATVLAELSEEVPELVAVLLRRNYGQTAAMAAGFDASSGEVIVTLDGDLQNDPADIPMLLAQLEQQSAHVTTADGVEPVGSESVHGLRGEPHQSARPQARGCDSNVSSDGRHRLGSPGDAPILPGAAPERAVPR